MTSHRKLLLDCERIRNRRRELGLSARAVEAAIGVSGGWLKSAETGANHHYISLREVIALARELGLDACDLLADRPAENELAQDHPKRLSNDAARLGGILVDLPHQTLPTRLASALGWPLERVEGALDVLEARLPATGQRLQRGVNGVQITRHSSGVDQAVQPLASARIGDNGLNPTQALILLRVVRGEIDERAASPATMSNAHRVALAELVNAGVVIPPSAERGSRFDAVRGVRRSLLQGD